MDVGPSKTRSQKVSINVPFERLWEAGKQQHLLTCPNSMVKLPSSSSYFTHSTSPALIAPFLSSTSSLMLLDGPFKQESLMLYLLIQLRS